MSTSTIVLENRRRPRSASASKATATPTTPTPLRAQQKKPSSKNTTSTSKSTSSKNDTISSSPSPIFSSPIPLLKEETGSGTYQDPFRLPPTRNLPTTKPHTHVPNKSGCLVCYPAIDSKCDCVYFTECLNEAISEVSSKRITSQAGRLDLCAKSILPCFMNRMIKVMDMMKNNNTTKKQKTFIDFGSGNGSVLFYIAWVTGIDCIGVELSPHNNDHAKQLWSKLKPKLEKRKSVIRSQYFSSSSSKKSNNSNNNNKIGNVTLICGDICDFLRDHLILPNKVGKKTNQSASNAIKAQKAPSSHNSNNNNNNNNQSNSSSSSSSSDYDRNKLTSIFTNPSQNQIYIWTANLLMPKSVTHFMAESFRQHEDDGGLPIDTKIMAFDDLYPHGRAVARVRDPEAFEVFEMYDFMWQLGSVEWTEHVEGMFHLYVKKK